MNRFYFFTVAQLRGISIAFAVGMLSFSCKSTKTSTVQQPVQQTAAKTESDQQEKPAVSDVPPGYSAEDSLRIKIGQMVMMGVGDRQTVAGNDEILTDIRAGRIGGIVLFEKNIAKTNSEATLKKMIDDLQLASSIPLFVSIDEEGGRVHRLKEKYGFFSVPSAAHLGSLQDTDSTTYYAGKLSALLDSLGFNLNYAPVLDVAVNPSNPVIAKLERSFSADYNIVAEHAIACIAAHHTNDVKTVLKHFPGHGSSSADSHFGMVDVTKDWTFNELIPYARVIRSGKCDGIMTAHIVNTRLDSTALPGTLSKKIIGGILRDLLNFQGVVFSDDMQMHAISRNYGTRQAIKLAINAGVDVVMFSNNVPVAEQVTASFVNETIYSLVKSGEIDQDLVDKAYRRIRALKSKKVN